MLEDDPLHPEDVLGPPPTGEAAIDDALRGLAELRSLPLDRHHERLARAHETLQSALEAPIGDAGGTPVPGGTATPVAMPAPGDPGGTPAAGGPIRRT